MIVFINRFDKFINDDLQHITIPKYHNFIKKNISSSSNLPVTSFFEKNLSILCRVQKLHYICIRNQATRRLAQLVQSIWFTPRGSGVRIPQRPRNRSLTKKFVRLFLFLTAFIQTFFILLPYNSGKRVNFAV